MGEFNDLSNTITNSNINWNPSGICSYIGRSEFSQNTQKKYKFPGVVTDSKGNKVYIKEVIYSDPATIVFWSDKTKTICKAVESDSYNPEAGLAICILKKVLGNTAVHDLFNSWCCFDSSKQPVRIDLSQIIKKFNNQR